MIVRYRLNFFGTMLDEMDAQVIGNHENLLKLENV